MSYLWTSWSVNEGTVTLWEQPKYESSGGYLLGNEAVKEGYQKNTWEKIVYGMQLISRHRVT